VSDDHSNYRAWLASALVWLLVASACGDRTLIEGDDPWTKPGSDGTRTAADLPREDVLDPASPRDHVLRVREQRTTIVRHHAAAMVDVRVSQHDRIDVDASCQSFELIASWSRDRDAIPGFRQAVFSIPLPKPDRRVVHASGFPSGGGVLAIAVCLAMAGVT
jgi:hypothetical protein